MTMYYVATLARYVLVEASSEAEARHRGHDWRYNLYADLRERLGNDVPINILTVRPATDSEIDLQQFHDEMVAREHAAGNGQS